LTIGILRISLHLPSSGSLKAKRTVVSGLLKQVRSQFGVAAAGVGDGDLWQLADLGFACVSNDPRHADEILSRILRFVEGRAHDALVANVRTEMITV
jgi:uncharacterized protein YlxP (DUF503 family)